MREHEHCNIKSQNSHDQLHRNNSLNNVTTLLYYHHSCTNGIRISFVHLVTTQATPPPPPKKRRCGRGSKFGRTTKGNNNKTAAAVTPGTASSQNRSRTIPNSQPETNKTATKLQRKCRDLLALKLKYQEQIKDLTYEVKSLSTSIDAHKKDTAKLVKSHNAEMTELSTANENRIKAIRDCHATELRKKAGEVKVLAKKLIAEKKASNEVSTWL